MTPLTTFRKWLESNAQVPFVARSVNQETGNLPLPEAVLARPWLWMKTSGTTSINAQKSRWIAHTRESLLCSATSVCQWLAVEKRDRWGRVLTQAHMGGLSIDVRAHVTGFTVVDADFVWDPQVFFDWILEKKITLLSLVPTQVFDLCRLNLAVPDHVRHVVVGGDRLDPVLEQKAIALGWPLLRSYGLTETASMIACQDPAAARLNASVGMKLLPHAQVRTNASDVFEIKSQALFCMELTILGDAFQISERAEEWWTTSDKGKIGDGELLIFGREDDFIKIFGESVNLRTLDEKLAVLLKKMGLSREAAFVPLPDARAGKNLTIVIEGIDGRDVLQKWNEACAGIERANSVFTVAKLPRSSLGKLLRHQLSALIRP